MHVLRYDIYLVRTFHTVFPTSNEISVFLGKYSLSILLWYIFFKKIEIYFLSFSEKSDKCLNEILLRQINQAFVLGNLMFVTGNTEPYVKQKNTCFQSIEWLYGESRIEPSDQNKSPKNWIQVWFFAMRYYDRGSMYMRVYIRLEKIFFLIQLEMSKTIFLIWSTFLQYGLTSPIRLRKSTTTKDLIWPRK